MKRIAIFTLILLVVAGFACFRFLDSTPYRETEYYKSEMRLIDSILQHTPDFADTDSVQCGWAKVNLLPPFSTSIAIDAARGGKHFEGVRDSIFVRAFVFKQGEKKIAFVSADLLIVPPLVVKLLDSLMKDNGYGSTNIFYTATHTHTSIGGWHNSFVGEIFAGKYDPRVPLHIAACVKQAIENAEEICGPSRFGFAEIAAPKLVFNRLVKEKGPGRFHAQDFED
jgi:neutral ceramidase